MERTDVMQAPVPAESEMACPITRGLGSPLQNWLVKRRGWVVIGLIAVTGTGVALGEGWITVAGLAPLLYTLPCAVMMMFCMRGMMSQGQSSAPPQTSSPVPPAPPAADPQ